MTAVRAVTRTSTALVGLALLLLATACNDADSSHVNQAAAELRESFIRAHFNASYRLESDALDGTMTLTHDDVASEMQFEIEHSGRHYSGSFRQSATELLICFTEDSAPPACRIETEYDLGDRSHLMGLQQLVYPGADLLSLPTREISGIESTCFDVRPRHGSVKSWSECYSASGVLTEATGLGAQLLIALYWDTANKVGLDQEVTFPVGAIDKLVLESAPAD